MFKKLLPKKGLFSIPLIREITIVLILKLIILFTIKHFYFSDPVSFSADHLFGDVPQQPLIDSQDLQDSKITNY